MTLQDLVDMINNYSAFDTYFDSVYLRVEINNNEFALEKYDVALSFDGNSYNVIVTFDLILPDAEEE